MTLITTPITIAGHTIKNRICMPPLVCFGFGNDESGFVVQKNVEHYEQRAKAGTGYIVVEATCVRKDEKLAPTQLGMWSDEHINGMAKIVETCKKYGAVVTLQIHHTGTNTHPDHGDAIRIQSIQEDFVRAAIRAKKAGFDGIQLHCCHGYLLNTFSSALVNKRTDQYGGNAENRTRLACDIIRDIRKKCSKEFIIDVRVAGNDPTPEDGIDNAQYYIKAGADMLSVSEGTGSIDDINPPDSFPLDRITWLGVNIKNHYPEIPVAAVYGIKTKAQAEQLAGYVDFVSVGRAMLADENWTASILEDTPIEKPCIGCKRCLWFLDPNRCPAQNK
ncbi:MAG: NADH:flavin oxidoreductase [Clostridiales bacterium]|nr:NADH:flavin oxidoreductase [Clostridiales bacterium]